MAGSPLKSAYQLPFQSNGNGDQWLLNLSESTTKIPHHVIQCSFASVSEEVETKRQRRDDNEMRLLISRKEKSDMWSQIEPTHFITDVNIDIVNLTSEYTGRHEMIFSG